LRECVDALRGCLSPFASESEHVMVVTDGDCRILWMEGDPKVRRRADRIAFQEGMDWTERSVGTNAIGTALAIDHAVQVFSAEHFSAKQHTWWCSAAPIHDPETGAVLGVVDLSGPMHTAHPHSLALVSAAARLAEHQLRAGLAVREERLRRAYLERTLGAGRPAAGLLAGDGRVLAAEGGWRAAALDVPAGGGPVALPGGRTAIAEPFAGGAGYVLWDAGPAAPAPLRIELLARDGPRVVAGARVLPLRLRHAEALFILALHPEGISSEDLTRALYGDVGKEVSTRAELSRLRKLLPEAVARAPTGSRPPRASTCSTWSAPCAAATAPVRYAPTTRRSCPTRPRRASAAPAASWRAPCGGRRSAARRPSCGPGWRRGRAATTRTRSPPSSAALARAMRGARSRRPACARSRRRDGDQRRWCTSWSP
jgi:hypothetical protein